MDKRLYLSLIVLLTSIIHAGEKKSLPELDFIEFLGEGKIIDGDYYDPLQIHNCKKEDMADSGQQ